MALTDAERKRYQRLREAGYNGSPCPEGTTRQECQAWGEGVWKRQAERMPKPERVPFPFNGSQA